MINTTYQCENVPRFAFISCVNVLTVYPETGRNDHSTEESSGKQVKSLTMSLVLTQPPISPQFSRAKCLLPWRVNDWSIVLTVQY